MAQLNVPAEIDKLLDYIHLEMRKPIPSDLREEVVAVGDIIVKEEAKDGLLSLLEQVGKEIIGEDDHYDDFCEHCNDWDEGRNDLRAAQRQRLNALLKGEKDED